MSEWSEEQARMLVEQNMVTMRRVGETLFLGVPFEGEYEGEAYVWSGVRWIRKKEQTWR
jgi:hypothetical protein